MQNGFYRNRISGSLNFCQLCAVLALVLTEMLTDHRPTREEPLRKGRTTSAASGWVLMCFSTVNGKDLYLLMPKTKLVHKH